MLAVLVERGCTDALDLAAREWRLQDVCSIDCAFGGASADERVQLVNKEDRIARGAQLFKHLLQSLFKLAAILCAGNERAHVESDDALVEQRRRNVAFHDALGEPFGDRRLADARFADECWVVLGAACQNLNDALNLLFTTNHRIEATGARGLSEIDAKGVEGWGLRAAAALSWLCGRRR